MLNFQGHPVRATYKNDILWVVAKDLCDAIELQNSRDQISKMLDYKIISSHDVDSIYTLNSASKATLFTSISEKAAYLLLARSDKIKARPFQDWLFGDVVPTIHRTGKYDLSERVVQQPETPVIDVLPEPTTALIKPEPTNQLEYLKANSDLVYKNVKHFKGIAKDLLRLKDNELTLSVVNAIKRTHYDLDLLKVFNPSASASSSENTSQYLVRQEEPHYNPTELAKILGEPWTPRLLNTELARQGFQVKSKANDKWEPTEKSFLVDRDSKLNLGCWTDTGKAHHSGLPVTTFRWYTRVLEILDKSSVNNLTSTNKLKSEKNTKKLKPSEPQETFLN